MICCLNPSCKEKNPSCPDETQYCTACGTELILLSSRYRPVKRIGEGGFGITYLAKDKDIYDEYCVIKQLKSDDLQSKEWFEGEAKKLKGLGKNTQIPTLLAYTNDNKYMYLVQEYIDGEDLDVYLQKKGTFTEEKIKSFLNELLPVLALIHEKKIVHRDIKLKNIMRRKEGGQLVLIDFGIAKQLASNMSTHGTIVGTPGYSPSEQMNKGIAIPASDLYSLGAACFHLLTGKHPYIALREYDYSWTAKWRSYLDKNKEISDSLGEIIDGLLQEKYEIRYQSANDVIKAMSKTEFSPTKNASKKSLVEFITSLINLNVAVLALVTGVATLFATGIIKIPSTTANEYYKNGQQLDNKDNKKSIEAYTKAIEINKNYTEAYIARGIARRDSSDNEGAIKDFTKAIELNPKSSVSYAYRGLARSEVHDIKNAEEDFAKVLKIDPTDSVDYNARGLALADRLKNNEAVKAYTQAINLNNSFWRAYINRGISNHTLSKSKDAIQDYDKAIKINPRSTSAYYNRGIARSALKDKKGAITDYSTAIEIKPDSSNASYKRGIVYEELKYNQKAIKDYLDAAKIFEEKSDLEPAKKAREKANKLVELQSKVK